MCTPIFFVLFVFSCLLPIFWSAFLSHTINCFFSFFQQFVLLLCVCDGINRLFFCDGIIGIIVA